MNSIIVNEAGRDHLRISLGHIVDLIKYHANAAHYWRARNLAHAAAHWSAAEFAIARAHHIRLTLEASTVRIT